jgi:hypothetical protein
MNSQRIEFIKFLVFRVWCLVFGMKYLNQYRYIEILNTKHQILTALTYI